MAGKLTNSPRRARYASRGEILENALAGVSGKSPGSVAGFFPGRATRASMSWVTSGSAGPPSGPENFSPWYWAGLWLAVRFIAPSHFRRRISWAMAGVGAAPSQSNTPTPCARKTSAAVRANSSEKKRLSYPTISVGEEFWLRTCSAMAATARRTFPKVNSSAITARQPEVPKWTGLTVICLARRAIVSWRAEEEKGGASAASRKKERDDGQSRGFNNLRHAT